MAQTVTKVTLFVDGDVDNIIKAKQFDSHSRFLEVTLIHNEGTPVDLTGLTARFNAQKPDNTYIFNNAEITDAENGVILVELTDQTLAIGDKIVVADISLFSKDSRVVLTTRKFNIHVQSTARNDGAIESSNEYGSVVTLFQDVWDLRVIITEMRDKFGNLDDDLGEDDISAGTSALGAINNIYNRMRKILSQTDVDIAYEVKSSVYEQTITSCISVASLEWALKRLSIEKCFGRVIRKCYNLSADLFDSLFTMEDVTTNPAAVAEMSTSTYCMEMVNSSPSFNTAMQEGGAYIDSITGTIVGIDYLKTHFNDMSYILYSKAWQDGFIRNADVSSQILEDTVWVNEILKLPQEDMQTLFTPTAWYNAGYNNIATWGTDCQQSNNNLTITFILV